MKAKTYQTLEEARRALLIKLNAWTPSAAIPNSKNSDIVRLEVEVENAHPLEWLTLQDCSRKFFWENRSQKEQFAGIGMALEVKDVEVGYENILLTISKYLHNSPKAVRFFGGMRFDSDASTSTEWKNWGTAHFSLSMVELSIVDEKATLACHIYKGDDIHEKLLTLQKMLESVRVEEILIPDSPLIRLERHDLPEYHQWCKLVKKGL